MNRAELLENPPYRAIDGTHIRYGRYRHPIPRPNISFPGRLGRLRLKEWHYISMSTDRVFIAFSVVHLGYAANAFCYLVDRRSPEMLWDYESSAPMGRGLRFAPSSVLGLTSWHRGRAHIEIGWDKGWCVDLSVPLSGSRLKGKFQIEPQESMVMLHELKPNRPAYTHKAAALPAAGSLCWQGEQFRFTDGLAAIDWTRSAALRETRWKWASVSARLKDDRTVGLNLSSEIYDDSAGNSLENALWVDGIVEPLLGVRFEIPDDPKRKSWRISSREGDEVDLEFRPLGVRSHAMDLKVLKSNFIQPYGTFHGRVRSNSTGSDPIDLDGAFGVVEDHLSLW